MSEKITDAEGSSVIVLLLSSLVVSWVDAGRFVDRKGWSYPIRVAALITAVLVTLPVAFFMGAVLIGLGSWIAVLAGAVINLYRLPGAPEWVSGKIAILRKGNDSPAPKPGDASQPKTLSATAWTVKRDTGLAQVGAVRQRRQVRRKSRDNFPFKVSFRYRDADGNITKRSVTAIRFGQDTFDAHCHLRDDQRTFRYERIIGDVVDLETGELIPAESWRDSWSAGKH
jgi:hypothetical protein